MSTDAQRDRILKVVAIATGLGRKYLLANGSVKSRKDFIQSQLMACLILRTCWKTTYRGAVEYLAVSVEVREAIGLQRLPDYSTLEKFADRKGVAGVMHAMFNTLARLADDADGSFCKEAAMDATGLPTTCASVRFESRRGKRQKRFVNVGVVVLLGPLVPASMALG
ncbi:MAG: hypothetical protein AAF800_07615 [Planctomycetota bacterium]